MSESVFPNKTSAPPVQALLLDISQAVYILFMNQTVLSSMLGFCELGSNIVSITVFIRQGMHSSINISFVVLSLVDLIKCLFILWVSLSVLNVVFGFYFPVFDVYSVISAWPIGMIERIGLFITAFVTIERYLSVAAPLNVKKIITSRRALAILIAIIVLHVLTIIPLYLSVTLGWRFYPGMNVSLYSVFYKSNKQEMEEVAFTMYAIFQFISICLIILFNFLLILQLKRQSNWRLSKSSAMVLKKNALLNREAKTNKMVITVATITLLCHIPAVTIFMTTDFVKELRVYGAYGPLMNVLFSFSFLLGSINSSAKIFIFYTMSSKFRLTFRQIFGKKK
ncbi:growth hormone secretagogue receptor type 1 [Biomphalaria glabrata]|nr:growth hormone secretagogue receptor type 1 [Biomphalaria glabrata]